MSALMGMMIENTIIAVMLRKILFEINACFELVFFILNILMMYPSFL
jgi:hypothetical protein